MEVLNFLKENMEWIFSGIGVALFLFVINLWNRNKKSSGITQNQKSGNESVNIQIGEINTNEKAGPKER